MYILNLIECLTAHLVSLTFASRFRDGKSPHTSYASQEGLLVYSRFASVSFNAFAMILSMFLTERF